MLDTFQVQICERTLLLLILRYCHFVVQQPQGPYFGQLLRELLSKVLDKNKRVQEVFLKLFTLNFCSLIRPRVLLLLPSKKNHVKYRTIY
jgi:hypothetical protein